jgi:hypothetical protein
MEAYKGCAIAADERRHSVAFNITSIYLCTNAILQPYMHSLGDLWQREIQSLVIWDGSYDLIPISGVLRTDADFLQ